MINTNQIVDAIVQRLEGDVTDVTWVPYWECKTKGKISLPYGFVQEMPGTPVETQLNAINMLTHLPLMAVTVLVAEGASVYPSPTDAAIKLAIDPIRDAVLTSLLEVPYFGKAMMTATEISNALMAHTISPVEYDGGAFMGVHFEFYVRLGE